ncbi:MAG: radical SAM protein [Bacteroidetes bacterium]|jgi:radical SAM enzyme (TIGR01210 family)|nr:radical SAM protein [Bacteroidota bacterium]
MPDRRLIEQLRPPKKQVDFKRPYNWLHENEPGVDGRILSVNTLFLTNKECSFKCVMCDLWKETLDRPTPAGAIPEQIRFGLEKLPEAQMVKLYNNGNFFDKKAIPPQDHAAIARLLQPFDTILLENHPKLCNSSVLEFQRLLHGQLEIAMGLESIHPDVLPRLNKQLTTDDFKKAADFLMKNGIRTRAFVLLNPPFCTDPRENIEWALKAVQFAFDCGVDTCSVIPTRPGNGMMDRLLTEGSFVPPTLKALEETFDRALQLDQGRVFADTWDLEKFSDCDDCFSARKERLERMNLQQKVLPRATCINSCRSMP